MVKVIYIFLGGGIGAVLRYLIATGIQTLSSGLFPVGTLAVNLIGCFIIGFLWSLFEDIVVNTDLKSFILVGIIGAFTTFSTYSLESINLIRNGEIKIGLLNILLSNVLGIALVFAGILSSRAIMNITK